MDVLDSPGQISIFDAIAAEEAKERGIDLASGIRPALLAVARQGAIEVALSRVSREVTADDVQQWLVTHGYDEGSLGNAAGGVFKGTMWIYTGITVKSTRKASHGRLLRVWRYVGAWSYVANAAKKMRGQA